MKKITALFLLSVLILSSFGIVSAQTSNEILIKNATILTASKGTLQGSDILIQNGKIAKIGKDLTTSGKRIDATGKFISPGIIDCHSHTMHDATNEFQGFKVTSMTASAMC